MNPLHSPVKEHSKMEFGKKNSKEKFGESETFSRSKFSPTTGVRSQRIVQPKLKTRWAQISRMLCIILT